MSRRCWGGKGGLSLKPCPGSSCQPYLPRHLLVLQDYVRQPDHGGGHPQQLDVVVLLGVPLQAIIGPLLGEGEQRGGITVLPKAEELVSCLSPVALKMGSVGGTHKRGCSLRCQPSMGCHPEMQTWPREVLPGGEASYHLNPDIGSEGLLPLILARKEGDGFSALPSSACCPTCGDKSHPAMGTRGCLSPGR